MSVSQLCAKKEARREVEASYTRAAVDGKSERDERRVHDSAEEVEGGTWRIDLLWAAIVCFGPERLTEFRWD